MAPTSNSRRRGKPSKYVIHPKTKEPIIGLRYWITRGQYQMYITDEDGKQKKKMLGKDFDIAYLKFLKIANFSGPPEDQSPTPFIRLFLPRRQLC